MSDLTDRLRVAFPSRHNLDACADLIDAIDALHTTWYDAECKACGDLWPCDTHKLIHPEADA